jgi:hypothetical protein
MGTMIWGQGSSGWLTVFTARFILVYMKHCDPIVLDVFRAYGSQAKLARELGVTRQAVSKWRRVPLKYVRLVSQFTGLTAAILRPDIYDGI